MKRTKPEQAPVAEAPDNSIKARLARLESRIATLEASHCDVADRVTEVVTVIGGFSEPQS